MLVQAKYLSFCFFVREMRYTLKRIEGESSNEMVGRIGSNETSEASVGLAPLLVAHTQHCDAYLLRLKSSNGSEFEGPGGTLRTT